MMNLVLSIMVLAAIALPGGAFILWRRGGSAKQITLMIVLTFIIIGNLAIVLWPDSDGRAPLLETEAPE